MPLIKTSPIVGSIKFEINFINVVLPDPFWPKKVVIPRLISNEILSNTFMLLGE